MKLPIFFDLFKKKVPISLPKLLPEPKTLIEIKEMADLHLFNFKVKLDDGSILEICHLQEIIKNTQYHDLGPVRNYYDPSNLIRMGISSDEYKEKYLVSKESFDMRDPQHEMRKVLNCFASDSGSVIFELTNGNPISVKTSCIKTIELTDDQIIDRVELVTYKVSK